MIVVVVVVRFVNEKRARNEQLKERRERTNANAGGRRAQAAGRQRAERAVRAAICASGGERDAVDRRTDGRTARRRLFVFLY